METVIVVEEINIHDFPKVAAAIKNHPEAVKKAPKDQKLAIYALGKQATEGDCHEKKPGALHLKEKKKWEAWEALKGMEKTTAMKEFIRVGRLILGEALIEAIKEHE